MNRAVIKIIERSKKWQSFKDQLAVLSSKEKGDAFELLTKYYLTLDPTYTTKLKHVWLLDDVPAHIRRHLNLPNRDEGIDLIAETWQGLYWAIQCKYREDESKSLTWREISTFTGLAFGICKNIDFGLICTSKERYPKLLKEQTNIGFCSSEVWNHLDEQFFEQVRAIINEKPVSLKPYSPRPHQKRALENITKYFSGEKNNRGKLIMPCGTGKSLVGFWVAQKLKPKTLLIAVPSLALMRQTLHVWLREFSAHKEQSGLDWICVCSDESVGRINNDDSVVLTQDLGIPCLTNVSEIINWFSKTKTENRKIIFTTYQSGKAIIEASTKLHLVYDFAILDEAHKTVGQANRLFSLLLFDKNVKIRKRLFMTATERRYAGKSDEIISMDNESIYGPTLEQLSFNKAIKTRPAILSDYRIVTMFVGRSEVLDLIERNKFVQPLKGKWNKEIEAEMLASAIALRKAMNRYPIKHAISFHSSIKRAELFKENQSLLNNILPQNPNLSTFHVSGAMPSSVRHRILEEFRKEPKSLVTNARCLTEGVDVPDIDCVLFADPKNSTIDIVQAVGRALRVSKHKKYSYVVVPVLVDDEKEMKELNIADNAFSSILLTLRALASNDERIIEYFRSVSQGKQRKNGPLIDIQIDEKLAKQIDFQEFAGHIELQLWDKLAKLSWRTFEEARKFAHDLGLKNVASWWAFSKTGKIPFDIPSSPNGVYKQWVSWGDWLGNGQNDWHRPKSGKNWRTFEEARKFVHELGLKNVPEWQAFSKTGKRPLDIPSSSNAVYKEQWVSWGDWLGNGQGAKPRWTTRKSGANWRTFEEARKYVHGLELKGESDWRKWKKQGGRPMNIPARPDRVYKEQWVSWGDWLGNGRVQSGSHLRGGNWRTFEEARKFVHELGLKNLLDWRKWKKAEKRPTNIPANPERHYKEQWVSWGDWLGNGQRARRRKKMSERKS